MKSILKIATLFIMLLAATGVNAAERYYYQIKIYHLKNAGQEARIDAYLQNAYLPALHKMGINNIGVFKPVDVVDTARKVYVFVPFKNLDEMGKVEEKLQKDDDYLAAGKDYLDAPWDNAPYVRIETILLHAFADAPVPTMPNLTANKPDRFYELRSYESPTEKYHLNKVKMFTIGGETKIFKDINSNPVFYGHVIAGAHMPNLMYLTTYNSRQDRDEHWKAFSSNPQWKTLSAMPEYQKNVSKNEQTFLHPAAYSDF
jgi:hypothetical protein